MNMEFPKLKISLCYSLPRWLSGKESACQCRRCKICGFDPWVKKIPWSRNWQLTVVFLSGKFHGERRMWATIHRVTKSWTRLKRHSTHTGGSSGKESTCNAGDPGSIPGLGRSPEEGNSYRLQYSCLENSMVRGAWQATVHAVTKSQTGLSG